MLKRAFRGGVVTQKDVRRAFDIGQSTASVLFRDALAKNPLLLYSNGKGVYPRAGARVPEVAGETALLRDLERAGNDPALQWRLAGVKTTSFLSTFEKPLPSKEGLLLALLRTMESPEKARRRFRVQLLDADLRLEPRGRLLQPLRLERVDSDWYLIAQDVGQARQPPLLIPLARIVDGSESNHRFSGGTSVTSVEDSVPVRFHPKLTSDQRQAISDRLGVANGSVKLPRRLVSTFTERYLSGDTASTARPFVVIGECTSF